MKVAVTLVEGFEIVEATGPIDMLRRAGISVDVLSVFNTDTVESSQKVRVVVDKKLKDVNLNDYDMLLLPGGAGTSHYYESEELINALKTFAKEDKHLAAICAAPSVLAKQGLLEGKRAISFPSYQHYLVEEKAKLTDESVVVDGKIITARAAGSAVDLGLMLVEIILGKEKRKEIEKAIVY